MPNFKECDQLCQYNTINGCKVIEMNGVCPLSNSTANSTQMAEARTAESYEAEIKELECEINSLEFEISTYKQELEKKELQFEFMRGQIEAFKICLLGRNTKNKGE